MSVDQELFCDPLPTYLTRFVGRVQELSELTLLVSAGRVVTLCGVAGSGKSRLAVECARRLNREPRWCGCRDGVVWVPLGTVLEPEAVARSVAAALGLREAHGGGAIHALHRSLGDQWMLLVLDDCEQVADGCGQLLDDVLTACPRVSVLATSRRPLACAAEVVFGIPSLGLDLREPSDAVTMFMDRATTCSMHTLTDTDRDAIGEICDRLDGQPLAIELFASWVGLRSPRELLETLREGATVPGSDAPRAGERRSIDPVLDSTWEWLAAEDRRVVRDLCVFHGGFDRAAAEAVVQATLASLSVLTDRSLIQRMPDTTGGSRYHMHEVVRGYAVERLTALGAESVDELRARHFDYFSSLVERACAAWDTEDEHRAIGALVADQANVDAALGWAGRAGQAARALAMSAGLASLWMDTAPAGHSAELLTRALSLPWQPSSATAIEARVRALLLGGHTALTTGDVDLAELRFGEALMLSERIADSRSTAWSLRGIGAVRRRSGDPATCETYVQRSLALCRETGDEAGVAWSRYDLGEIAFASARFDDALTLFEEAAGAFGRLEIWCGAYRAHTQLGELHRQRDERESALASFERAVAIQGGRNFVTLGAVIFEGVAGVAAQIRQYELAAMLLGAGDSWRDAFGHPRMMDLPLNPTPASRSPTGRGNLRAFGESYEAGRSLTSVRSQALLASAISELTAYLSLQPLPARLTGREVEVLRLVALGLSNADIANLLDVSPRTVHAHLRSIFDKLGVTTRTAAAREAVRIGVTDHQIRPTQSGSS